MHFNLPDDAHDYRHAAKGYDYYLALRETADDVFRPARKHGYPNRAIQDLVDKIGDDAEELIGLLESEFSEILVDLGINLLD
jgi:hypothetical protein